MTRVAPCVLIVLLVGCGDPALLGVPDDADDMLQRASASSTDGCSGIISLTTLSASSVLAGKSGAFVREMTGPGYASISGYVTPPDYATSSSDEQPWVYFGVGDGHTDIEAGLAFQHGDATKPRRWRPFIRKGSRFVYADEAHSVFPGTRVWIKAYYRDGEVALMVNGPRLVSVAAWLDPAAVRLRRIVAIATPFAFNGSNLASGGLADVVFEETKAVRRDGQVLSLRSIPRSFWQQGGVYHGSVCWPASRIRYRRDDMTDRISVYVP